LDHRQVSIKDVHVHLCGTLRHCFHLAASFLGTEPTSHLLGAFQDSPNPTQWVISPGFCSSQYGSIDRSMAVKYSQWDRSWSNVQPTKGGVDGRLPTAVINTWEHKDPVPECACWTGMAGRRAIDKKCSGLQGRQNPNFRG